MLKKTAGSSYDNQFGRSPKMNESAGVDDDPVSRFQCGRIHTRIRNLSTYYILN